MPTSAMSFSSIDSSRSSPGLPSCAKRGACRVAVAKCWLPHPPRHPPHQDAFAVGGEVGDQLPAVLGRG